MPATLKNLQGIRSERHEAFVAVLEAICKLPDSNPPKYLAGRNPSDLFVNPTLYEPGEPDKARGRYWEAIHQTKAPVVISGPKKAGKTLLLKWIARHFAAEAIRKLNGRKLLADEIVFPLYIDLTTVRTPKEDPLTLGGAAVKSVGAICDDAGVAPEAKKTVVHWLCKKLASREFSQLVIIYDNLETIIGLEPWMTEPFEGREQCSPTYFAARLPCHDKKFRLPNAWPRYEIRRFKKREIDEFLKKWDGSTKILEKKISKSRAFRRLMSYPYILTLACLSVTDETGLESMYKTAQEMRLLGWGRWWWLVRVTIGALLVVLALSVLWRRPPIAPSVQPSVSPIPSYPADKNIAKQNVQGKGEFFIEDYYTPSGKMGDTGDLQIGKEEERTQQFIYITEGKGPYAWEYQGTGMPSRQAGVMYLDPPNNWGMRYGGQDLRGFRSIVFEARSLVPVNVVFVVGGVTWVWDDKLARPVPNAFPDRYYIRRQDQLTTDWKRFTIPLEGPPEDLQRVIGAFGWVIPWEANGIKALDNGKPDRVKTFTIEIRNLICTKERDPESQKQDH